MSDETKQTWAEVVEAKGRRIRALCTPKPSPVSPFGFTLMAGDKPWASFRDYYHADEAMQLMAKNIPEFGPFSVRVDQGWLTRRGAA